MSQIKLNSDGDIDITGNKFSLTVHNSDEEIAQRLVQKLKFFFGEWFLDVTQGVPWFQIIFEKGTSPDIIEGIIKEAIIETEGVVTLDRFEPLEYDPKTRELTVVFDVTTINGENLPINEVLP